MSWTDRAACVDVPTEVFFPVAPRGCGRVAYEPARKICAGCPVRAECPAYTTPDVEMPANTIPGVGVCACGEPFTQTGRMARALSCSPKCAGRRKRAERKAREAHDFERRAA